ncbi:MAG: hypothetical protein MJZ57_08815 [Bacteroidales bacterium]|nr:hypothetical protein [Bacteroidales bacterium]
MKIVTPKITKFDWLIDFGLTKDYYIFMVRSDLSDLQFANAMSRLYHQDFSFLTKVVADEQHPGATYSLFFSSLSVCDQVYMSVLNNKTSLDPNLESENPDPLLGLFMFEDDSYIFNKQGRRVFDCPYSDYDYLIFLSCPNGTAVDYYINPLKLFPKMDLKEVSDMLQPKKKKGEEQKSNFLKNLFNNCELLISEYETEHLKQFLGEKNTIAPEIYPTDRIPRGYSFSSALVGREDI